MARKTNCNSGNKLVRRIQYSITKSIHQYSQSISLAFSFALHGKKELDSLMDAIRKLNILKHHLYMSKVL